MTCDAVVAELRGARSFVLCTHEHPDGDALGSLAAMQHALTAIGKDAVSFMAADEFPLPYEYRFLTLDRLVTEPPADFERAHGRLPGLRQPRPQPRRRRCKRGGAHDRQHRPSPRQHALRHGQLRGRRGVLDGGDRVDAAGAARRAADARDRRGAVRRPGHRHRQVHVREHRAGRAPHGRRAARGRASTPRPSTGTSTRASRPPSSTCSRAGSATCSATTAARCRSSYLSRADYEAAGAEEGYSEGVVDHLRALEGTVVAALVRDQLGPGRDGMRKISLRAVRRPRRRLRHRPGATAAAGIAARPGSPPSSEMPEIVEFLRREVAAQLRPGLDRRGPPRRQAGRRHVARRRRPGTGARSSGASRWVTPGRWTRLRPGCCWC